MVRTVAERKSPAILEEVESSEFADVRLGARFRKLVCQLSQVPGAGLSIACEDWANTKAAYRFLSNPRVHEAEILSGHFEATRRRFQVADEAVLILHDTTEFSFKRANAEEIGVLKKLPKADAMRGAYGPKHIKTCGILMHSSLIVTRSGVPLGLGAVKFWTRDRFKGTNALKRKINPTRVPIEEKESIRWLENLRQSTALLGVPKRCVHIGDRESDIFELFHAAVDLETHFLVRTCVDRLACGGETVVSRKLSQSPVRGFHSVTLPDAEGVARTAKLAIKFMTLEVCPPLYKGTRYPPLVLTVVEAIEQNPPKGQKPIVWKLLTNLPVRSLADAKEKLRWYAMRWKIETFHKILKSGCKAEDSRLRSAERLANLFAIFCILGWRIFWITMLRREIPDAEPSVAFTSSETAILARLTHTTQRMTLHDCILQVAKLGGYLARTNDPPPGNIVMWRGLSRLSDLVLGASLQMESCG